jgi:hypothetical protein
MARIYPDRFPLFSALQRGQALFRLVGFGLVCLTGGTRFLLFGLADQH